MVESVNGMPASLAARAARISPSPCCMPNRPTGARMNGDDNFWPTTVVARLRAETSTRMRWRSLMRFQVGAVGAQRLLVVGAAVGVIEERARNPAARQLPQVFDQVMFFMEAARTARKRGKSG